MLTTAEWNPGTIIGVSYVDIPPQQDPDNPANHAAVL